MNMRFPLILGAAVALLAACGDRPEEPQQPAQTQPAQTQPAQTAPARQAPATAQPAAGPGDAARGEALYVMHCVSCHGVEGRGDGPAARALRPPPTDFTTAELAEDRTRQAIRDGGPSVGLAGTMPAFNRMLNEQQLNDVVAYTLSLGEDDNTP